jgi:chemotaxis protein MotA
VNPSTLIGMVASVLLMAVILMFASDDPLRFVDGPSLAIVLGGTLAATFLSYPLKEVLRVFHLVGQVLRQDRLDTRRHIEELVALSRLWMQGDLQAVERALGQVQNPFLRTGVQLVIDRTPEDEIVDLLQWRIAHLRSREAAEAQIFRLMASYAPAFGMLGTLLGLINLMDLVGAGDMKAIGQQLAIALVTTFYGVLLANLVFKPIAVKLERRTEQRLVLMNMVLEGISLMCAGRSPALMRETLKAFVAQYDDEIFDGAATAARPAGSHGGR